MSLSVASGELLAVVGPSGSGKSTLLRVIAGLDAPDAGRILLGGRDITHRPPGERDVAMVFQNYALYPHMSVRENLSFGLSVRRLPRAQIAARVAEVTSVLGLEALLDRKPAQLSGGQQQRVAVGRALVRKPALFLFDEPLSNLDASLRLELRGELARLHARAAATAVYVTHDQAEAMTLGHRVAVLRDGRLQQVDAPLSLYRRPENLFVARFIGSPPMNVLHAGARVRGGAVELSSPELSGRLPRRALHGAPPPAATVGVRPEDLSAATVRPGGARIGAGAPGIALRVVVERAESLGAETYVYVRTLEGRPLIVRGPGDRRPPPGDRLSLSAPPEKVHLFDPGTGARL